MVLSRNPFSSAPLDASSSMISKARLVSLRKMALARSRADDVSPMPNSSRACVSVISPVPYETANCSNRFSASRKEPHADCAPRVREHGRFAIDLFLVADENEPTDDIGPL